MVGCFGVGGLNASAVCNIQRTPGMIGENKRAEELGITLEYVVYPER